MAQHCKQLIFLGDGMGDRPVDSLGGLTPLEYQRTPALDFLAAGGECGLMYPIRPGMPAGSDTAHMAILGYDPFKYYMGRGPFEAKGVGLDVQAGDLAFRCNFSTLTDGVISDRRAGRIKQGTDQLAQLLNEAFVEGLEGVKVIVKESVEHRAALVLRGEGLSAEIGDADPHEVGVPPLEVKPLPGAEEDPAAQRTARIVNEFVRRGHEVLAKAPVNAERAQQGLPVANVLLPRGVGTAPNLKPFSEEWGLNGALIVEVDLVRGLGMYLGMNLVNVPQATGGADTDELAIAEAVVSALESHDFVLCNIKAPDLAGHDYSPRAKCEAVAKVDRAVGYLLDHLDWKQHVMMLGADHCTPCALGDHSGDGVPVAFYGYGTRPDYVQTYGERPCATGSLGKIGRNDVMYLLGNLAGTIHKFGA
ncbi:MAG: 2,3-bisphosphoglycerate-independent phosphoglycerate mutase [candidate division WS1 bacterium]|nr:2,3-bisphosphoglycerate-independent phosphoglycerate mutase [candidate division WS1 bacterium]